MKQYTFKEFTKLLNNNDFYLNRKKGDHFIFTNSIGKHISVPFNIRCVIAKRLIKENNLK